jgi:hypothetical protein
VTEASGAAGAARASLRAAHLRYHLAARGADGGADQSLRGTARPHGGAALSAMSSRSLTAGRRTGRRGSGRARGCGAGRR